MKSENTKSSRLFPAMAIGRDVRLQREVRGLSQRELAELAGTSQGRIAQMEAGEGNPTLGLLNRVSSAMNTEIAIGLRRKIGG